MISNGYLNNTEPGGSVGTIVQSRMYGRLFPSLLVHYGLHLSEGYVSRPTSIRRVRDSGPCTWAEQDGRQPRSCRTNSPPMGKCDPGRSEETLIGRRGATPTPPLAFPPEQSSRGRPGNSSYPRVSPGPLRDKAVAPGAALPSREGHQTRVPPPRGVPRP